MSLSVFLTTRSNILKKRILGMALTFTAIYSQLHTRPFPRRVAVISPLGTGLGVAAGPRTLVHGVDSREAAGPILCQRVPGEQFPQCLNVDAPLAQGRVEAAPASAVYG